MGWLANLLGTGKGRGSKAARFGSTWYLAENPKKRLRQVVLSIEPDVSVDSRFAELALAAKYSSLVEKPLDTGLFRLDTDPGPFLMLRADGLIDEIRQGPLRVGFSFFRMPSGGVFVVYVASPVMEEKLRFGFLEKGYGLDGEDVTNRIRDAISGDALTIVMAEAGGMFGVSARYDLVHPLDGACRDALATEWHDLLKYHHEVRDIDFQRSMNEMWSIMPETESPLLGHPK